MTGPCLSPSDTLAALERAVRQAGLLPKPFVADGTIKRCPVDGKPNGRDGAYIAWADAFPRVWFQNWRTGASGTYSPNERATSPAERKAYREQEKIIRAERARRDAERESNQSAAAASAAEVWKAATPDAPHSYLMLKQVKAHGTRVIDAARARRLAPQLPAHLYGTLLVVPLFDGGGTLHSLQFIDDNASKADASGNPHVPNKRYLKNGRKQGCFFLIGPLPSDALVICEGFATGASVQEATGLPVAVAFDTSGLSPAAEALRATFPAARLLFAADDDYRPEKPDENPGFAAAEKAASSIGGVVVRPVRRSGPTDFNDMANDPAHGPEAVRRCFGAAVADEVPVVDPHGEEQTEGEPGPVVEFSVGSRHYRVDDGGVWCAEGGKRPLWLCGRLDVTAKTSTEDGTGWGRWLEWRDDDGTPHSYAASMELLQEDGLDARKRLAQGGLHISTNRYARELLEEYIQECPASGRYLCVDRLGWCGGAYALPDRTIGETGKRIVYQGPVTPKAAGRAGTAESWRDNVGALAAGNSRLVFAASVAFAAPLLEMTGEASGGFHIRGGSSSGKTTALKLASSVFGNPRSYVRSWRSTDNGLEGVCVEHNDRLLALDEVGQVEPGKIGDIAYMIANGQGKARASRSGASREAAQWRTLVLSSGEEAFSDIMALAGKKARAGQEIRFADIEADAGAGMGAFEEIHRHAGPSAFANAVADAADRHHGAVGVEWLECLVADRSPLPETIRKGIRDFIEEILPPHAGGQVERVARRFALAAVAGELATHYGLTGWPEGEADAAAKKCFLAWLEGFGGPGNQEERAILAHVRAFFEAHGATRFQSAVSPNDTRVVNRAGFFRDADDGSRVYYVLPGQYKAELCRGFNQRAVTAALIKHGWIVSGADGKTSRREWLPGMGQTRAYVFGGKMWECDHAP